MRPFVLGIAVLITALSQAQRGGYQWVFPGETKFAFCDRNGNLYLVTSDVYRGLSYVRKYNRNSDLLWTHSMAAGARNAFLASDGAIAIDTQARVIRLSSWSGEVLSSVSLSQFRFGATALTHRASILHVDLQQLACFSGETGELLWRRTFPQRTESGESYVVATSWDADTLAAGVSYYDRSLTQPGLVHLKNVVLRLDAQTGKTKSVVSSRSLSGVTSNWYGMFTRLKPLPSGRLLLTEYTGFDGSIGGTPQVLDDYVLRVFDRQGAELHSEGSHPYFVLGDATETKQLRNGSTLLHYFTNTDTTHVLIRPDGQKVRWRANGGTPFLVGETGTGTVLVDNNLGRFAVTPDGTVNPVAVDEFPLHPENAPTPGDGAYDLGPRELRRFSANGSLRTRLEFDRTALASKLILGREGDLWTVRDFFYETHVQKFETKPLGRADYFTTNAGVVLNGRGLMTNDVDQDGDTLVSLLYRQPAAGAGTVSNFTATGTFRFTPAPGFKGNADFYYRVRDPFNRYSSPILVRVTVR